MGGRGWGTTARATPLEHSDPASSCESRLPPDPPRRISAPRVYGSVAAVALPLVNLQTLRSLVKLFKHSGPSPTPGKSLHPLYTLQIRRSPVVGVREQLSRLKHCAGKKTPDTERRRAKRATQNGKAVRLRGDVVDAGRDRQPRVSREESMLAHVAACHRQTHHSRLRRPQWRRRICWKGGGTRRRA